MYNARSIQKWYCVSSLIARFHHFNIFGRNFSRREASSTDDHNKSRP